MPRLGAAATAALAAASAAAALLAGCGQSQQLAPAGTVGADAQVGGILLRDVHVEDPVPGGSGGSAIVRLTLVNQTGRPDALTGVRTDVAQRVDILADTDCTGTGRALPRLDLPAGGAARGGIMRS